MVETRRERERESRKALILEVATEIIKEHGIDGLSIRKIATRIEYAPSVIYHYFKDKEEILDHIMQIGYDKIMHAVATAVTKVGSAEEVLKDMTRNYIRAALDMPEEFMSAQLSQSAVALRHTSSMFRGAVREKPALAVLAGCISKLDTSHEMDEDEIELRAQMVAASTLGLILKLISEKDLEHDQKNRLIDFFTDHTVLEIAGADAKRLLK
jgi:AcrR family transcriptional regulator